ncbi:hypothetical protein QKU48_gp1134 [Fadolivirus algeromassiliense]|jgi:hypothetical protein|uniref:Uncharacterized protein n=1 Tax=Fadolivirus FV1/VV64 TaxID=3070911 RepID=A0A7D3V5Z8_9VIRU|nr:hypothetical protein QKU48_gp1134 [Fadolivirus algeromassiliense]QKF94592.1 hypothetical protein Fadolivirus_1_1134 [Fadolivirus FV1/VV64]
MAHFIGQAKLFSEKRKQYLEKYNKIQEQKKESIFNKIESKKQEFYSHTKLSLDELNNIGKNIIDEFNLINNKQTDDYHGVPGELCFFDVNNYFDEFNKEIYKPYNDYHNDEKETYEKQKNFYTDNQAENCKKVYEICLNEILKHNIDIYGIQKDLNQYKNGNTSSLCGGTTVFTFYCKKNNFKFTIEFDDDCDCFPGILSVNQVEDMTNNKIINIKCDLFCQNMSRVDLENFLLLINNTNYEEYIEHRYGDLLKLPYLLRKYQFVINFPQTLINKKSATINTFDFTFVIEIMSKEGSCLVIPYHEHNSANYSLYICPTLSEINRISKKKSYHYERTKIDINVFNHDMKPNSFKIDYQSEEDIENLVRCINSYIDYRNGKYGYFENGKFRNENTFLRYINKHAKNNKHISIHKYSNNFTGPDFDIFVSIMPANENFSPLTINRLKDTEYPYDYYGIHFYYDKKVDPDNCILTIQGKWHDLTQTANEYYANPKEFNSNIVKSKSIASKYGCKGKYSECFSIIIELIEAFYNIENEK